MLYGYIRENTAVSENRTKGSMTDWVAQHSELGSLFAGFQQSFSGLSQLPPNVLPLCRIRMAQLHGNQASKDAGEAFNEMAEAVAQWPDNEQFSPAEKACLAFTEVYAMDVHAITDAQADAVKLTVGEPGLVALVQALGVFYAETRLGKLWGFSSRFDSPEYTQ